MVYHIFKILQDVKNLLVCTQHKGIRFKWSACVCADLIKKPMSETMNGLCLMVPQIMSEDYMFVWSI